MHDKEKTFNDVIFLVTHRELTILIDASKELWDLMDGDLFDDNTAYNTMKKYPTEPGFYKCSIRYTFDQGYFEGWRADGESDWDFEPFNITKVKPTYEELKNE